MKTNILKVVISLIITAIGVVIYLITRKKAINIAAGYFPDSNKETEIKNRNLDIYKTKISPLSFRGISYLNTSLVDESFGQGYFPMTDKQEIRKKIKVGSKTQEIPTAFDALKRAENREKIRSLITKYDTIVTKASHLHKVPRIFIYGAMAVENINGSALAVSTAAAYGIMQVKHSTAVDTVKAAVNLKVLTNEQISYFKGNSKYGYKSSGEIKISPSDLLDAEININLSCVELSILIDKFGLDDPHKVMISYNQGRGRLANDGKTRLSINEMIDYYSTTSKREGANYLMRTLGKDGSFDILFNDLKVQN